MWNERMSIMYRGGELLQGCGGSLFWGVRRIFVYFMLELMAGYGVSLEYLRVLGNNRVYSLGAEVSGRNT